jgi:hypothetical protein
MRVMSFASGARVLFRELAIVLVAAFCIKMGYEYFGRWLARSPNAPAAISANLPLVAVGQRLNLRDFEREKHPVTILLALSPTCRFCRESASLHGRILAAAANNRFPVFIAVPNVDASRSYLVNAQLGGAIIKPWADLNLRVRATPTIALADANGVIRRVWIGQLDSSQERRALELINSPNKLAMPPDQIQAVDGEQPKQRISSEQLETLKRTVLVTLLDVRDRGESRDNKVRGFINILLDELSTRAGYELDKSRLNVVDCSTVPEERCDRAVDILVREGFRAVELNLGAYLNSCGMTKPHQAAN